MIRRLRWSETISGVLIPETSRTRERDCVLNNQKTVFRAVQFSLMDMLGEEYLEGVCRAREFLTGDHRKSLQEIASEKVDFFPTAYQQRLLNLLPEIGRSVCPPAARLAQGATTGQFRAHANPALAPLSGMGYYRLGEDGRLFLITKSEHYHASLGHSFPGYSLVDRARKLGVPNATHNNTRGHITRILEEQLTRAAAGIASGDMASLRNLLSSGDRSVLNRVINLETGSVAAEAAVKLILARFYRSQEDAEEPKFAGKIPVFVVLGDDEGTLKGNYHGTNVVAQILRGMWPQLLQGIEKQNLFLVRAVRPNNFEDLEAVFTQYNSGQYKIAGFFFELVMMNYGARRLREDFVRRIDSLCEANDVVSVVDEIQTCVWSPELFMFREYGIKPTAVVLGKGFPGGEYAASRILFSAAVDNLPQFGALVTNGQEELASIAYLVTMWWVEANAEIIRRVGEYYEERLHELSSRFPNLLHAIEGNRHMAGLAFQSLEIGKQFVQRMLDLGLDISVQTYKTGCPPVALTKLPLIVGYEAVDAIVDRIERALKQI